MTHLTHKRYEPIFKANTKHTPQRMRAPPLRKGGPGGLQQEVRTLVKELNYKFVLLFTGIVKVRTLSLDKSLNLLIQIWVLAQCMAKDPDTSLDFGNTPIRDSMLPQYNHGFVYINLRCFGFSPTTHMLN